MQCVSGTCAPFGGVGDSCGPDSVCDPLSAFCDDGTCAQPKPAGEDCATREERQGTCVDDFCADRGGDGTACDDDFDCVGVCDQSVSTCGFTPPENVAACGPYHR